MPWSQDIRSIYAKNFTQGNIAKAKKVLEGSGNQYTTQDLFLLSMFSGGIIAMVLLVLFFMIIENYLYSSSILWDGLAATNPVMRITFIISYILFATGIVIRVFRTHSINYLHIFELDYRHKITEFEFWVAGMTLLFIWTICFCLNILEISLEAKNDLVEEDPPKHADWISLVLVVVFLFMCVQPCFNFFYRNARYELLYVIF